MISGTFKDIKGNLIEVRFMCSGDDIVIGEPPTKSNDNRASIFFTDSPVNILEEIDDSFEHIIKRSCSIDLLSSIYLGDYLFSSNDKGIEVIITKQIKDSVQTLFRGYTTPNTFQQDYAHSLDKFTINCVDFLSTLENHSYKEGTTYEALKQNANNVSFKDIINGIFGNSAVYYDKSIGVNAGRENSVFDDILISELLFLGDSEDDWWNNYEVLKEILQYLNLHIRWYNDNYYIFNWNSIRNNTNISFYKINGDGRANDKEISPNVILKTLKNVKKENYASDDTNLSIADVYNQIKVDCDIKSVETVISNPLNDDDLYSPYENKYIYAERIVTKEYGFKSAANFVQQCKDGDELSEIDEENILRQYYYTQLYKSKTWSFNTDNLHQIDAYGRYYKPNYIPQHMHNNTCQAAIIATALSESLITPSDDSIKKTKELEKSLVLSINGNGIQTEGSAFPSSETIRNACGNYVAKYNSSVAAGAFTPTDDKTKNYLVFSGEFYLKTRYPETATYSQITAIDFISKVVTGQYKPLKLYDGKQSLHLTKYNINNYINDTPVWDGDTKRTLQPLYDDFNAKSDDSDHGQLANDGILKYIYKYSAIGDETDKLSKLPVLECELKIGDYYCVETSPNEFEWMKDNFPVERYDGITYEKKTFSLGCNPKIGDWILNKKWEIANTISDRMNINMTGTAIPLPYGLPIEGHLEFKILGPVNLMFDEVCRRHPSFWRHTKWSENSILLLPEIESINITSFDCKFASDNGNVNNIEEKDLVYISNEVLSKYNIKDGITFRINTALTTEEALAKGVKPGLKLSNPIYNGQPLISLYSAIEKANAKAEELYVNDYWKEYSEPKVNIESTLHYNECDDNFMNKYQFNYFGDKTFYPVKSEIELKYNRNKLYLKEI